MHSKGAVLGALLLLSLIVEGCRSPEAETGQGVTSQIGSIPLSAGAVQASPPTLPGENIATFGMAPVQGQAATCGGPRTKTFDIEIVETTIELGGGTTFVAWTFGGRVPGPTLEVCEGDDVTINVINTGTTAHGLDTHAFKINAANYGPTAPGTTLTMQTAVDTPGVYMYHCASGPVTDLHIKSGLHGAMIVYPRDMQLRPARELVIVESAVYGQPDDAGTSRGQIPT